MKHRNPLIHYCLILLMVAGMILVAPASTQSQAMPRDRDDNPTWQQLAGFDSFLESHPEVAEQLRKDPSLVNNQEFVEGHPALKDYLQQHPKSGKRSARIRTGSCIKSSALTGAKTNLAIAT
jgi:hypothetical protein